jgi:hypothetical protein
MWSLVNKIVIPLLLYAIQIWGCKSLVCVKIVQNQDFKNVFKPNIAVRGECGRYQIRITALFNVVKYW